MTIVRPVKTCQLTKYPEIYAKCYWGQFNVTDSDPVSPEIIDNRNTFIEDNGIMDICRSRSLDTLLIGTKLDHLEAYRAKDGRVLVLCSNYGNEPFPLSIGFTEYPAKMYYQTATTYLKIFETGREFQKYCNELRREKKILPFVLQGIKNPAVLRAGLVIG
jgi:hypothetical protein